MSPNKEQAAAEFRRMIKWIALIGVVATGLAILYLAATGDLHLHMVIAVIGGVFLSVLLGCGLFAASFFSDKSGHDQSVTDATKRKTD
ncbi:hypothetical protein ACFQPG_00340 [Sphingomonas sp. GCM10030256]|uniref:hypothetical protein n=1 Tax=Sphingomonas sp. GCM10030256 TaxID=3273427 RepID=UPI00361455F2